MASFSERLLKYPWGSATLCSVLGSCSHRPLHRTDWRINRDVFINSFSYFYLLTLCTQIHTKRPLYQEPLLLAWFCWAVCRQTKSTKDRQCSSVWGSHTGQGGLLFCGEDVFPLDDYRISQAITFKVKFTNLYHWDASKKNVKAAKSKKTCKMVTKSHTIAWT